MTTRNRHVISLFCGPGGFDEGFRQAGFQTVFAADIDIPAIQTHRLNHPQADAMVLDLSGEYAESVIWNQLQARLGKEAPIGIIGGPPCQSFSVGNSHKVKPTTNQLALPLDEGGEITDEAPVEETEPEQLEDPRDKLPAVYASLISHLQSRYRNKIHFFVFENVCAIKNNPAYLEFKEGVRNAGFRVFETDLDAVNFGVPQFRKRLFIIGVNTELHPRFAQLADFPWPSGSEHRLTVGDIFQHIHAHPVIANSGLLPDEVATVAGHPNHWCMDPKSPKLRSQVEERWTEAGKPYRVALLDEQKPELERKMGGKSFKVLSLDQPSYTVAYGHREVHFHPEGHRRLSVYEALLLQGFPETYRFAGTLSDQIRLVSEVVAPPVARALGEQIQKELGL